MTKEAEKQYKEQLLNQIQTTIYFGQITKKEVMRVVERGLADKQLDVEFKANKKST